MTDGTQTGGGTSILAAVTGKLKEYWEFITIFSAIAAASVSALSYFVTKEELRKQSCQITTTVNLNAIELVIKRHEDNLLRIDEEINFTKNRIKLTFYENNKLTSLENQKSITKHALQEKLKDADQHRHKLVQGECLK
jgi:hypothetical protein